MVALFTEMAKSMKTEHMWDLVITHEVQKLG